MKKHLEKVFLRSLLIAGLGLLPAGRVTSQTFTVLHGFTPDADYSFPTGGLVISGDTLYGTTTGEGSSSNGGVFAVKIDGTGFTNLHRFTGTDGASPSASLILSSSTLYGVTSQGGSSSNGTVFAVNTDGTGFTNLHSFNDGGPGEYTDAGLIISGNTLYGTTGGGGSSGDGGVFAIKTDGTGFTNLHSLDYTNEGLPWAGLLLLGNTLYGTTDGTVFTVNTDGTAFTVVHRFSTVGTNSSGTYTNSDGFLSRASLVPSGNTLYGTASQGGSLGYGIVFSLNENGTEFKTLHSFTGDDGIEPSGRLILSGSTLYGTTTWGGSTTWGTMFAIHTDGTGFTNLHSFNWGSTGAAPFGGLILSGNTLYGTASDYFNDFDYGTVYSLSFPSQPRIGSSGSNVVLSWPTNDAGFDYTGFTLQSTTNLILSAVWITNSPAPVVVNGQNLVTIPPSAPQQFFRLSQ